MSEPSNNGPQLKIGDKTYPIADLGDDAKKLLRRYRIAEAEIARLQNQLGLAETAKAAFATALQAELSKKH